jgi:hypothetical protein
MQHPNKKTIHYVETPIISPSKKIQGNTIRIVLATVFRNHKGVTVADTVAMVTM